MRAEAADGFRRFAANGTAALIWRVSLTAGLAILLGWASGSSQADPGSLPTAFRAAPPPVTTPGKKEVRITPILPKKPEEIRGQLYAFSFEKKPWRSVFDWLVENSGKPVVGNHFPTSTFTFLSPKGKRYTMPEVIDIINEGLLSNSMTQKYYMINR